MTIWRPSLENSSKPRYIALADAIASDIASGQLPPGTKLPTHRDLATRLGVTVGTVSRAYGEAERRGLIRGEVGRGTFVRDGNREPVAFGYDGSTPPGLIDLSLNRPATGQELDAAVSAALASLAQQPRLSELLTYQPAQGLLAHRLAGAAWMARSGPQTSPDNVIVTHGGQHALFIALSALTKPGDTVLAEKLTYPGIKTIASQLRLNLRGVEMDSEGILPDAFEAACKARKVRLLVCVPNLQNPTAGTLSLARRQRIGVIARAHDVILIEDDIYGFLLHDPPPALALVAPERTYYLTSLSKSTLPGIRVGYLHVPEPSLVERFSAVIRSTTWMVSPLLTELATRWINDGTAQRLVHWQRAEAEARQTLAAAILKRWDFQSGGSSLHFWLTLPSPWGTDDFVHQARAHGVQVTPAGTFAVDRADISHGVRVCVSAANSQAQLQQALIILDRLLGDRPGLGLATI